MQHLFIAVLLIFSLQTRAQIHDPSADIQVTHLANGLRVVYAPSENAKTVQIRIRVDAGRWTEDTAGVAHLLEHYIFKDAKMDRDMTYLEVIKENGGSGNAYVNDETTTYHATVPPPKAEWLLGTFAKMIVNKQFVEEEVDFAKKPVYLEIGQPNPFHYFAAFMNKIMPSNMNLYPSFWETEFGFRRPDRAPVPDQITTAGLKGADVKAFYDKYYNAKNMTLFIAGNFNVASMKARTEQAFAALPAEGKQGYKPAGLTARVRDYKRSSSTSGTPNFEVGTKMAEVSLEETMALHIYLDHLAHRLMKELRNTRGETYTVRPKIDIRRKNGYASVEMEAPREAFYKNLDLVRGYIQRETREGKISPELYKEAIDLYGHKFKLTDKDSETMMALAERADSFLQDYGEKVKTPFQIYSAMTLEQYKAALQRLFASDMEIEKTSEPPIFFRYEEILLTLLGVIAWSAVARRVFARKFRHSEIRWVRKFVYPPAYLGQIFLFAGALGLCALAGALLYHFWMQTPYLHASFLIGDYLLGQISLGMMYFVCQTYLLLLPRKLMVVGSELWIKSLGYGSHTISLNSVKSAETAHPFAVFFNPKAMWRIKYRFFTFNFALWQPGILVKTASGKDYFLGVTRARDAAGELRGFLKQPPAIEPVKTPAA